MRAYSFSHLPMVILFFCLFILLRFFLLLCVLSWTFYLTVVRLSFFSLLFLFAHARIRKFHAKMIPFINIYIYSIIFLWHKTINLCAIHSRSCCILHLVGFSLFYSLFLFLIDVSRFKSVPMVIVSRHFLDRLVLDYKKTRHIYWCEQLCVFTSIYVRYLFKIIRTNF